MSGTMRLSRNAHGIVVNDGDRFGDDLISMSSAEREIREATVGILLNMFRRQGEFTCTKVRARRTTGTPLGSDLEVSGYVTILRDILGKSPRQLEGTLGIRDWPPQRRCRDSFRKFRTGSRTNRSTIHDVMVGRGLAAGSLAAGRQT